MHHDNDIRFAHHRLDVYGVALRLFKGVEELAGQLPRGYADARDQVRRAASAVVRNIAEAAAREHAGDKANRFSIARGEVAECDAVLEMMLVLGVVDGPEVVRLRRLADRVSAMLLGLVRRERRNAGVP